MVLHQFKGDAVTGWWRLWRQRCPTVGTAMAATQLLLHPCSNSNSAAMFLDLVFPQNQVEVQSEQHRFSCLTYTKQIVLKLTDCGFGDCSVSFIQHLFELLCMTSLWCLKSPSRQLHTLHSSSGLNKPSASHLSVAGLPDIPALTATSFMTQAFD